MRKLLSWESTLPEALNATQESASCITRKLLSMRLFTRTKEIISFVKEANPQIIGIDAPLSLPPGRKSLDDNNGIHLRECDKELTKRKIRFFPITLGLMRMLTLRGISLKKSLKD